MDGIYARARSGDKNAISIWNAWCETERRRLSEKARGLSIPETYVALWGG
jgi:hypothetical protein